MARKRKSSGSGLQTVAIVAGGLAGVLLAVQALGGSEPDKYADEHETPSRMPKKRGSAPVAGAGTLKKGQKSEKVRLMQEALIQLGGEPAREIKASGGADGTFGPATERALLAAGVNPQTVTAAVYANILKSATAKATQKPALATGKPGPMSRFLAKKGIASRRAPLPPFRPIGLPRPMPATKPVSRLVLVPGRGPLKFTTKAATNRPIAKAAVKAAVKTAVKAPPKQMPKLVLLKGSVARAVTLPSRLQGKSEVAAR